MHTGQEIVLAVVAVASILLVLALFVWAAVKDGQEDKALQKRLRIRRRMRLGR
jgi:type II secretory pathway pseudopilin PulG